MKYNAHIKQKLFHMFQYIYIMKRILLVLLSLGVVLGIEPRDLYMLNMLSTRVPGQHQILSLLSHCQGAILSSAGTHCTLHTRGRRQEDQP